MSPVNPGEYRVSVFNPNAIGVAGQFDVFDLTVAAPGAVATGFYEGAGMPTALAPQGTLYYDTTGTAPNFAGGGGFLWEYTGTGTSTTATLIGNGVVGGTPSFTVTVAGTNIFSISTFGNAPPSLTGMPFHVFLAGGAFNNLFVADASGVYHFVATVSPGAN